MTGAFWDGRELCTWGTCLICSGTKRVQRGRGRDARSESCSACDAVGYLYSYDGGHTNLTASQASAYVRARKRL